MDAKLRAFAQRTKFKAGSDGSIWYQGVEMYEDRGTYNVHESFGEEAGGILAEGATPDEAFTAFLAKYDEYIANVQAARNEFAAAV